MEQLSAVRAVMVVFRRIEDRNEWRSEDGRWLIEKSYDEGKRGGTVVHWRLYRAEDGRWHSVATERRRRDLWSHVLSRRVLRKGVST